MLKVNKFILVLTIFSFLLSILGCGDGVLIPIDPRTLLETDEAITTSTGEVEFSSNLFGASVQVKVEDYDLTPLQGVNVKMVADTEQIVIIAFDPEGLYLPAMHVIEKDVTLMSFKNQSIQEQDIKPLVVVVLILKAASVGLSIHEFVTSPPGREVVEIGGGQLKRCRVIDLGDVIATAGLISGVGGILKITYHGTTSVLQVIIGAGTTGTEVAAKLVGLTGMQIIPLYCTNEALTGPDGRPIFAMIGPIEGYPITELPSGLQSELVATGRLTGHVANLHAKNETDQKQLILIYPGISFENSTSSARQDVTVIKTISHPVSPGEEVWLEVRGACIHAYKGSPRSGDRFIPFAEQRPDLIVLGQAIDRYDPPESISQEAIWVITDNRTPRNYDEVKRLFIAAGLDPNDYEVFGKAQTTSEMKNNQHKY